MQRGIDSFFKRITPAAKKPDEDALSPAPKKRKARVISSDEEEIVESPQVSKSRDNKKKRPDNGKTPEKNGGSGTKKPSLSKLKASPKKVLKAIDPSALFGVETVRVEAKRPPKPKEKGIIELEDDEIDQSLMEIDVNESVFEPKESSKQNGKDRKEKKDEKTPTKSSPKVEVTPTKEKKERTGKERHQESKTDEKEKEQVVKQDTPKAEKKQLSTPKSRKELTTTPKMKKEVASTPKVRKETSDLENSVLSDEERHDRKRMAAILYQKYKNRSSCINPGSKEVPKGKPNCLAGITFLVTGVLESLERDEAASIIKELGGKVMTVVGKRLHYLVVGEDAGPKKLVQAEEFGVKTLSEDGLFDLIRQKSGGAPKSTKSIEDSEEPTTSAKAKKEIKEEKVKKENTEEKVKKENTEVKVKKENIEVKVKKEKSESPPDKKRKLELKPTTEELNNNYSNGPKEEIKYENTMKGHTESKLAVSEDMMSWVDKYKPTNIKEIVGQHGAASNVVKLTNWLSKWYINQDGSKKLSKPSPWAKNDDGAFFKAALLSGPPGIGKTTTASLVCKELGFDTVEFNASDTRSKRLLKEQVSELLSNKSLFGYFHGNPQAVTRKHVLIMDEVDGMAGNEDRGGIQELIGLIKDSSVPIICMCNDRNHQKMRSLVNYCFDLRFNRPRVEQIKGRILSICFKENIKLDPAKVEEIIAATNNDIRQSINHIFMLSASKELKVDSNGAKKVESTAQKDLKIGPWEVVRKVFSVDEHKHMTIHDKCDLFFHDYSLAPLFVQQNYLQVSPAGPKSEVLQKVALTADALSLGDLVDKRIRSNMAWSLLPTQAAFSSFMPGEFMSGYFTGQPNFPGWLGKNSRATKRSRLAQELHNHTRLNTSGSRLSMRLDYAPFLLSNIVRPLKDNGLEGVEETINVLKNYHLLREDIDSLIELTSWSGKKSVMDSVDGRVKAALTRTYNRKVLAYSYSATAGVKKKKMDAEASEALELLGMEGEEGEIAVVDSDEEKEDDVANDGLIKAKVKPAPSSSAKAASTSKKSTAKPKTSKAKK